MTSFERTVIIIMSMGVLLSALILTSSLTLKANLNHFVSDLSMSDIETPDFVCGGVKND